MVGGQPLAVAMHLEPELRVDAFGRPLTVAAQIARRPVLDEPARRWDRARLRIQRTPSSRRRRAARAPRRRERSGPRPARFRASRHARTSRSRWPAARAGRQPRRRARTASAPNRRRPADASPDRRRHARGTSAAPAASHARAAGSGGCRASCRARPIDQAGKLLGRWQLAEGAPRTMRFELVERVPAGRDRDRPRADGVRTLDVVRRVADHEHAIIGNRTRRARQRQRACGNARPVARHPRRTRRRGSSGTGRSA